MSKKNGQYSADVVITSANHAEEMSDKLPSVWSQESLLSQRTLIYVAKLLEEQNALLALAAHRSPPNKRVHPTASGVGMRSRFGNWLVRLGNRIAGIGGG